MDADRVRTRERNSDPGAPVGASPLLLAALLFTGLAGESHSQGEERRLAPGTPKLCGEWHRGAGAESPIDPGSVKRAYASLREAVAASLGHVKEWAVPRPDQSFDAGLPACAGEGRRTVRLGGAAAERLPGVRLAFLSVPEAARLRLPPEVARDPGVRIFLVKVRALGELPEIGRAAGRPVGLAGPELAKALGVRCADTLVDISEDGNEASLHELH